MFVVKLHSKDSDGIFVDRVFRAYAYAVKHNEDAPEIALALTPIATVDDFGKEMKFKVDDTAYIMNEAGKTIETVRNYTPYKVAMAA